MNGSEEYIYEAVKQGLDHVQQAGKQGSRQKILLLTDEEGNTQSGGEALAGIRSRADQLGVTFEILFIAESGRMDSRKMFLQYLEMAGIDFGKLNTKDRMDLWKRMLEDETLDSGVKEIVIRKVARESDSKRTEIVLKALKDSEGGYVRAAATEALGQIGTGKEIPHLAEVLHDPFGDVIQAATEAIEVIQAREGNR